MYGRGQSRAIIKPKGHASSLRASSHGRMQAARRPGCRRLPLPAALPTRRPLLLPYNRMIALPPLHDPPPSLPLLTWVTPVVGL